ncbi:glutathione S-transferase family protein [Spiribacter halobius]|uniref:glutathione S-transferase family protein n=1 Tax=Sediminicurvatus halobius TaxID=2182432 RepID=UPI0011B26E80|nr:glutathione S-transferase family protein [Spiribacter halobius]UEX77758.1 glutathione S-transferase family protein [Spiribacter halobius]
MSELILHHYPPSPFSEKVRIAFGIKGVAWRSVEIPRVPPRPLLFPMTGGYRRTPVLQVGADIYCDTALILAELERRYPRPTLFPEPDPGLTLAFGEWVDGPLFRAAVAVVLGTAAENLPEDFARDRVRIYFGPGARLEDLVAALPDWREQLQGRLRWLEQSLPAGADYFCGGRPGQRDAQAWYLCWFLNGRHPEGRAMVDAHPRLAAWYLRMEAIGHGSESPLSGEEALALCAASEPGATATGVADNPQGLRQGDAVAVRPQGEGGDPEVEGTLQSLDAVRLSLQRRDPEAGTVTVHFPRVGYRLRA